MGHSVCLCLSGMCVYACDSAVGIIFNLDMLAMLCSVYTTQHEFVVWGQVLVNQFFSIILIKVRKSLGRRMEHTNVLRTFFLSGKAL